MAAFESSRKQREERRALLKLLDLDVPLGRSSPLDDEHLAYGFDVNYSTFPPTLVTSDWGDDYEIALFGKLGLHCHNIHKGTNFKFVRWEKYSIESTAYTCFYVTLDAKDPASDSDFSFQTLLRDDSRAPCSISWFTLACRIRCTDALHEYWDDTAIDDFYKGAMPKWLSDEELLTCDNKKYYVVQESDFQENDWLHLFAEIAFYSKTERVVTAPQPLEIVKVVVVTNEDTAEAREKLKAKNAIFYVSYRYNGESLSRARDHKAIIRKTMDGKEGHMCLEVEAEE